jgi:hypothetical protein
VFTARYALSPYIKQISFVSKGLKGGGMGGEGGEISHRNKLHWGSEILEKVRKYTE